MKLPKFLRIRKYRMIEQVNTKEKSVHYWIEKRVLPGMWTYVAGTQKYSKDECLDLLLEIIKNGEPVREKVIFEQK